MAEFLSDPSVLTKHKLKSALLANNVALPNGEHKKDVYVELYLKNLTSQNQNQNQKQRGDVFSSDEEGETPLPAKSRSGSGRKATRKTDRVRPEEIDVTELTNEGLKDQLLKYGVNAGPIVGSTRKVYEKKLQKFLDQGPPEPVVSLSEATHTDSSQNGNTDSDQYSDKEEAAVVEPEVEPEPEPEPVPVVERPLRSRGKTPTTSRTRSSQHKPKRSDGLEEDFQVLNVQRKTRRSSCRLDQSVLVSDETNVSECLTAETLPAPREGKGAGRQALPEEPRPLLGDKPSAPMSLTHFSLFSSPRAAAAAGGGGGGVASPAQRPSVASTHQTTPTNQLSKVAAGPSTTVCAASSDEVHSSVLSTALVEGWPDTEEILSSGPLASGPRPKPVALMKKHSRTPTRPQTASAPLSGDLIHVMCQLSLPPPPPPPVEDHADPPSPTSTHFPSIRPTGQKSTVKDHSGSSPALPVGKQSKISSFYSPVSPVREPDAGFRDGADGAMIEKLSAVEQTPKTTDRDVLKDMFPLENLNTPTGISATRRQPIRGAASRPFSSMYLDDLRPRLSELCKSAGSSSYGESRVIPRLSSSSSTVMAPAPPAPLLSPPTAAPRKAGRRMATWGRLLLGVALAAFLLLLYQAMESNHISPFGQTSSSSSSAGELDRSAK